MADVYSISWGAKRKKSPSYEDGSYTVILKKNAAYFKGKDGNVKSMGSDIAYDTVCLWAEDMAKEYGIKKLFIPKKIDLEKRIENLSSGDINRQSSLSCIKPRANHFFFKNKGHAKNVILAAHEELGVIRCREMLSSMLDYLELAEQIKIEQSAKSDAANVMVAESLYEIFVRTGVDMSASINNSIVSTLYRDLLAQGE